MSLYWHSGAAVLMCARCPHEQTFTWQVNDPPIPVPQHCGEPMVQITHNDGQTPLWEAVCPEGQGCCERLPGPIAPLPAP